ncbi:MAG: T9SS type A sorting domain-containing protein [Chryseolinea sp.]
MIDSTRLFAGAAIFFIASLVTPRLAAQSETHRFESWMPDSQVDLVEHSNGYTMLSGGFTSIGQYTGSLIETDPIAGALADTNFPKFGGSVYSIVGDGSGGYYVSGYFSSVDTVQLQNLAHVKADMTVDRNWKPNPDGEPTVLTVSGNTLYVGGYFTKISGAARNFAAAYNITTGAITAWNPNPNNQVDAITVSGTTIYLGGYFTKIGVLARQYVAAVDASTGIATGWVANCNNVVEAIAVSGTNVFLGGYFTTVGGLARSRLANVDATTGIAKATWITNLDVGGVSDLIADNDKLYVAGSFTAVNAVVRNGFASITLSTAALTTLNPADAGSYFEDLLLKNNTLYMCGGFTTVLGSTRNNAAAIDVTTGTLLAWDPETASSAECMAPSATGILLGGYFNIAGGISRNGFALIDNSTDQPWPFDFDLSGGTVNTIAVNNGTLYIGGAFTAINKTARKNLAAFDIKSGTLLSWNPVVNGLSTTDPNVYVSTMKIKDNLLYIGGKFYFVNTPLNATTQRSCLATVDLKSGVVDKWDPSVGDGKTTDQTISSIDILGNTVYVAGSFSLLSGSQARGNIAAIDATSASILPWNPVANGDVDKIRVTTTTAYVVGNFANGVGGQIRNNRIAALDLASDKATPWDPPFNSSVNDVALSVVDVYVAGYYNAVDTLFRPGLSSFSLATGKLNDWTPDDGDNDDGGYGVSSISTSATRLYVAGDIRSFGFEGREFYGEYDLCPPTPGISIDGTTLTTDATGTLQWYKNGKAVAGATKSTYNFDPYEYSVYYVTSTTAGCLGQSAEYEYLITSSELTANKEVKVFPNPVHSELNIQFSEPQSQATFTLLDITGRAIKKSSGKGSDHILSFDDVDPGPYVLVMQTATQKLIRKIIKIK